MRVDEDVVIGINAADCHLFDGHGNALERRVELKDFDFEKVLAPEAQG